MEPLERRALLAGITVTPTTLTTSEAAGALHTATFTVVLDSQPSANVTIDLASSDPSEGTVSPDSLTFTPGNWDTPRTVTVTAVDDFVVDGNVAYTINTAPARSADPDYNGLNAANVSVTNQDNDRAGITVTPTTLTTSEAAGALHTATFTVVLDSQPSANVTIDLASSDPSEGTVSPDSLTFTPGNWHVPRTVTVTAVDDSSSDGDVAYTINTAPARSADPDYNGLNAANVSVTNLDDDVADLRVEINVNKNPVSVNEVLIYTVRVASIGPGMVTDARLRFTLPSDVDFDSATGGARPDLGVITFNFNNRDLTDLNRGIPVEKEVRVIPLGTANGKSLSAGAKISSTIRDPNPLNDEATERTAVRADLQVTSTEDTNVLGTLRFAINLANTLGGLDVITISPDLVTDLRPFPMITLVAPLPEIQGPVIIRFASGDGRLTINANCMDTTANPAVLKVLESAAGSTIQDLAIINYQNYGIWLAGGGHNTVLDTFVGVDPNPLNPEPVCRGEVGIYVDASNGNTMGPTSGVGANVIGNHRTAGIQVAGGDGNRVIGNLIGATSGGTSAVDNGIGVLVTGGTGTTIGGATAGAGTGPGNIIAGNSGAGIAVQVRSTADAPTRILGNLIGATDGPGDSLSALANALGIEIKAAAHVAIGGTAQGAGNRIAGNSGAGVHIEADATDVTLAGNVIGRTSDAEALALGNAQGVLIEGVAAGSAIHIGGTDPGSRNVISGNRDAGVALRGGARDVQIQGNWIGLNAAGTGAVGNGADGIGADPGILLEASSKTLVGGTTDAARNVISGNAGPGIQVTSSASDTRIQGNWIGLSAFGTALERSNGGAGVLLDHVAVATVGGTDVAARNVISGNAAAGVKVTGAGLAGVVIAGNFIGTDPLGAGSIPNAVGVRIHDATGLDLGDRNAKDDLVEPANVISGNNGAGVLITGALSKDIQIRGNRIGTRADGRGALANQGAGVEVQSGLTITIGGTDAAARNIISGNGAGGVLVKPASGGTLGIVSIAGNFIGTDLDGQSPLGNAVAGVKIAGAADITIGGTESGARNVISGNGGSGVWITGSGATGNKVWGNLIGTNAKADPIKAGTGAKTDPIEAGTESVRNADNGVLIDGGAVGNFVGGLTATPGEGRGNVISGNGGAGVLVAGAGTSDNQVLGNLIGTDLDGQSPLGNAVAGVKIAGAAGITIGGADAGARNVISGNGGSGVWITGAGAVGNKVWGNLIGTNAKADPIKAGTGAKTDPIEAGTESVRNADNGVLIDGGAVGNFVGGLTATPGEGRGNVISGNAEAGVRLAGGASGNIVAGNLIGTAADGSSALGNAGSGVVIEGAVGNTIGGANQAARNILSGNGGDGVQLLALATANVVAGNRIGLGLDGAPPLPNAGSGVGVTGGAHSNTIGGDGPASKNRIVHNTVGILVADPAPNGLGNVFRFNDILSSRSDGVLILNGASRQVFEQNLVQGNTGNGFSILASGLNTIGAGNVITGNSLHGVQISGENAAGNTITYNEIHGNTLHGVFISNAPRNAIDGNQVLGNGAHGVVIQGAGAAGNTVSGNLITANNGSGVVVLDGQTNAIDFNRVGGNQGSGVALIAVVSTTGGNRVGWNLIGADPLGGNRDYGVDITNSSGNAVVGNVIARNGLGGVHVFGATASGNAIGAADIDPARPGRNVIAANTLDGVKVEGTSGTQIVNNEIRANANDGVELSGRDTTGSVVSGNLVLDNRLDGVRVVSAPKNTIGPGNTIAGNSQAGVEVTGRDSRGTAILGNFIGTQEGGRAQRGNRVGVLLIDTTEITVGGAAPLALKKTPDLASANIIAGNTQTGIQVSGTSTTRINVRNNLIGLGLDASGQGTRFFGNGTAGSGRNTQVGGDGVGVWIVDARSTTVRGNFLSGNDLAGVHIQGRRAVGNVVERNWIGVDTRGRTPYETTANSGTRLVAAFQRASNQGSGVLLNATSGNLVGGSRASRGNLIAGNDVGVRIIGDTSRPNGGRGNRILNNAIERNEFGVFIDNAPDAILTGNAISGNISIGLAIRGSRATGNVVASNAIDANRGQTDFPLEAARTGTRQVKKDVGTGIYIEGASANTIQDNSIRGNALAGLYFFGGASGNGVRRNTITELKDARGRVSRGQYGILLFNSASNVFAIVRRGKDANVLSGSRLANFREFTGPRTETLVLLPGETLPRGPNTLLRRDARRG